MAYAQLVIPNPNQTAKDGLCLYFSRSAFGAPAVESSAWEGWLNTKYKHTDRNLPNVAVPVWFQHYGNYGNPPEYKNWGHVAIYVPGRGVLTSPITFIGTGQQWYSSIDSLVNKINQIAPNSKTVYVGWSEDISNVRVAKEDNVITIQQVDAVLKMGLRREPTADELNNPAYQADAGLVIDTVWNNGGKQLYDERNLLAEENAKLKNQLEIAKKQSGSFTESDRTTLNETNSLLKKLWEKFISIFK